MINHIVDSHVHFWDSSEVAIEWINGSPVMNRTYYPSDYFTESSEIVTIEKLIFVEADVAKGEATKEAAWVSKLAETYPQIQAIVANAPMVNPSEAETALLALKQYPLVRGIRRLIQSEPLGFSRQPGFIESVKMLSEFGYSFDICIYHQQLEDVLHLVEQCPDTNFVLDHIAKPNIKDSLLSPWKAHIAELASDSRVWCKLSGMVTEADHANWQPDDLRPYAEHIIDTFGADRLMYGGDWPVVKFASSYVRWFETASALTAHLSEADQKKIFYDNASTFYRL